MEYQSLFIRENEEIYFTVSSAEIFPIMLSLKVTYNLNNNNLNQAL